MHDLRRKLLSLGNHFFERLKTANFSTACGTSTLKSLPSRAFAAPHVHPRPRKRPPRCTLDCGFKTSESPALRGFVGGPRALATAALYLVLKSNGLRHSKNLPVKFGFSSKTVPANIVQKLSAHSLLKSVFFRISTSLTNGPRSLSRAKAGTHSALLKGSHTTAHTPKQGLFRMGALLLPSERFTRFGNPAWPGVRTANFAAFGSWSEALLKDTESLRNSDALMRVAVPQASRPRWAALPCCRCSFSMIWRDRKT